MNRRDRSLLLIAHILTHTAAIQRVLLDDAEPDAAILAALSNAADQLLTVVPYEDEHPE